jgi:hypothetical protein
MNVVCPNHTRLVRRICGLPSNFKTAACTLALNNSVLDFESFLDKELFLGVLISGVGGLLLALVIFEIADKFVVDFLLLLLV